MEVIKIAGTKLADDNKTEADKLKVCAYIRVSTDADYQEHSYESQRKYFTNKIYDEPNWEFVGIYGDEGISGTKTDRRIGFMKMIRDANNKKIDLILTKSISRFARNAFDTLKYVRMLKEKGVAIYFEEEKINTSKISGEFLITVLGSIAQQESYNLSSHVQYGLKMKMMRGENVGYYGCYGYRIVPNNKTIEIVQEQAEIVRNIFDMYIKGYGLTYIKHYLEENNIKTFTNKSNWSEKTIRGMLLNEKYAGDIIFGKHVNKRTISKINDDGNLYYIKDHHPAIIDRDQFELVQRLLKTNHTHFNGNPPKKNEFSKTLRCGFCGKQIIKRMRNLEKDKLKKYYCTSVIRGNWTKCPKSAHIDIELIKECFYKSMKKLFRKFKNNLVNGLSDFEYNYVYKILCEYEKSTTYNSIFYEKIIKYVIIGDEGSPFNIHFVIKLEDDIFSYLQYLGEDPVFTQQRSKIFSFVNKKQIKYFKTDDIGVRHLSYVEEQTISVEYERDLWK